MNATIKKPHILPSETDLQYREFKILIKAAKLKGAADSVIDFWNHIVPVAKSLKIDINKKAIITAPHVREILFYDTPDFKLFKNSYIVRSRRFFVNSLPQSVTELTIKFRDRDFYKVDNAKIVINPILKPRIKYKEELLPLAEKPGGMRAIFAKNYISSIRAMPRITTVEHAAHFVPNLKDFGLDSNDTIKVVNDFAVEELETSPGTLDFGNGIICSAGLSLWRDRHWEDPLVGEFSFQVRAQNIAQIPKEQIQKMEDFYKQIQLTAADWIETHGTKTAMVYGPGVTHNE